MCKFEPDVLSVRDQFAMSALNGLLVNVMHPAEYTSKNVDLAYKYADLLLERRNK